jgi:hypothetical protein
MRLGLQHDIETLPPSRKIWRQHFDAHLGDSLPKRSYGSGERPCALIGQVIPADGGDHHELESHSNSRVRKALSFLEIFL